VPGVRAPYVPRPRGGQQQRFCTGRCRCKAQTPATPGWPAEPPAVEGRIRRPFLLAELDDQLCPFCLGRMPNGASSARIVAGKDGLSCSRHRVSSASIRCSCSAASCANAIVADQPRPGRCGRAGRTGSSSRPRQGGAWPLSPGRPSLAPTRSMVLRRWRSRRRVVSQFATDRALDG
jgi:hypothetical protein